MQQSTREKKATLTLARPEKSAPAAMTSACDEDECEFPSSGGNMFSLSPRESVETHEQYSSDREHYSKSSADAAGGASVASGASSQQHAAESVASECSVSLTEADDNDAAGDDDNTSSKAKDRRAREDSKLMSDADSAPSGKEDDEDEEKKNGIIKRCASGGSIVTYDQAGSKSKLRDEDGECERTGDRRLSRRSKETQSNAAEPLRAVDIDAELQMAKSPVPAWTDDKHHSFLNSIEQTFVNSLYGQNHRTVDGSGQDDQDCVESRPMDGGFPYRCEPFTILQKGCYDQVEYYRPQFLHHFVPSPAIFLSPWVQHFNPKTGGSSNPSLGGGVPAGHDGAGGTGTGAEGAGGEFVDGEYPGTGLFGSGRNPEDVKEEVMESNSELPEAVPNSLQPRSSSRYQSQQYISTAPVRPDGTSGLAKKRSGNVDATADYRPKKLKSTQRLLAAIDLEMEEQFVLEQMYLKKQARGSGSKAATEHQQRPQQQEQQPPIRSKGENGGGLDLNQAAQEHDEETTNDTEDLSAATATAPAPEQQQQQRTPLKAIEFITPFERPVKINVRTICEEGLIANGLSSDLKKAEHHHHEMEASNPVERRSAQEDGTGGARTHSASAADYGISPGRVAPQKPGQDAAPATATQGDLGFDEDAELDLFSRKSPRGSKTYTWGSIGSRRRLQHEWNGSGDANTSLA